MDDIWGQVLGVVANLLVAVLVGLLIYGYKIIKVKVEAYLATRLSAEELALLKSITNTVVRYLEQSEIFAGEDGARKKETALNEVQQFAAKYGIGVDFDLIDRLVEEQVQIMNAEKVVIEEVGEG